MIGIADGFRAARLLRLVQRDLEIGAQGFGKFFTPVIGDGTARDPIDQFAVENPDGERVIGRLCARWPLCGLMLDGSAQGSVVGYAAALQRIQEHEPRQV